MPYDQRNNRVFCQSYVCSQRNCLKSIGNKVLWIIYVCELPLKSSTTIIVLTNSVRACAFSANRNILKSSTVEWQFKIDESDFVHNCNVSSILSIVNFVPVLFRLNCDAFFIRNVLNSISLNVLEINWKISFKFKHMVLFDFERCFTSFTRRSITLRVIWRIILRRAVVLYSFFLVSVRASSNRKREIFDT